MINENAVILLRGEQVIDAEHDVTEVEVAGTVEEIDGCWEIKFTEYLEDGDTVHTEIIVKEGFVAMKKQGALATAMTFEEEMTHIADYSTPFGNMQVSVHTQEVNIDLKETFGRIQLEYTLDFNMGFVSENKLEITINPADYNGGK